LLKMLQKKPIITEKHGKKIEKYNENNSLKP
jgi:hypothetical protein